MDDLPKGAAAPWDREDAASRSLLRLIAQSTNDGIWDWDLETNEVYYSPRWLELIGYLPGELRGHIDTFVERLHPDDRASVEQSIAEYRSGARFEYRVEFRLRHKNGSWRSILTRGIVLRDAGGRAVRFAGTHTDITDRVRAAERLEMMVTERTTDLRAARDRAELTNAATTKFLATASHDIRQPLQAMALLLGGLKGDVTTEDGARKLRAIERSLASGMELLDALLEFSKLDAGALRPRLTTVGIGDLFDVVNDTFAVEAAQKGLRFTVMPTRLATRSDAQLLGRILRNLVSNAIKYTDRGRILIGCRRRGNRVRIEVWDTGCGIPADQRRQIFWEFVQIKERGRSRSGLGLGLAIVDRLAKLLGHSVEIRSWPGRGSVFAVEMALERMPSPASIAVPTAVVPDAIFTRKLIAIIEDDAAVADALTGLLQEWGATPIAASDDGALLRALAGRRPDAVIADRDLGEGGDGFAALSRLEATLGGSLPSLVLTGDYDVRDLERVNEAGRRVLHKPVWPAVLHAVLRFELSRLAEA
jgi:two-component system, sensor histidine kinase